MARQAFDLDALKASGFTTNDRRHLEKAHNILLGYPPDETEDVDVIKGKLREITKTLEPPKDVEEVKSNVTPILPNAAAEQDLRKMPNLGPNGQWGGLMMGLRWTKRAHDDMEECIVSRWETAKQYLLPDKDTYMPWPLYKAFKDAITRTLKKKWSHDMNPNLPDHMIGMLVCEETIIETPKYLLTDLGPQPGTENLCRDYLDYFQRVAKKTVVFQGVSRSLLLKVHNILFGDTPITALVGVTDRDLRVKIASALGPEYEHLMDEELYGEAVA